MNDKIFKRNYKLGLGSLSPLLYILGLIIFYLSNIIVNAKKVLDLPQGVWLSIIFLAWYLGKKHPRDFAAKRTKKMFLYMILFMLIMIFTLFSIFYLSVNLI
jgi:hypothetical protein